MVLCSKPPPKGSLKFNVCGVKYEDAMGSGGVLKDDKGIARAVFWGPSEAKDADIAEVGAIKIALDLVSSMGGAANYD